MKEEPRHADVIIPMDTMMTEQELASTINAEKKAQGQESVGWQH